MSSANVSLNTALRNIPGVSALFRSLLQHTVYPFWVFIPSGSMHRAMLNVATHSITLCHFMYTVYKDYVESSQLATSLRELLLNRAAYIFHPHDNDWISWTAQIWAVAAKPADSQTIGFIEDTISKNDRARLEKQLKVMFYEGETFNSWSARANKIEKIREERRPVIAKIFDLLVPETVCGILVPGSDLTKDQIESLSKIFKENEEDSDTLDLDESYLLLDSGVAKAYTDLCRVSLKLVFSFCLFTR